MSQKRLLYLLSLLKYRDGSRSGRENGGSSGGFGSTHSENFFAKRPLSFTFEVQHDLGSMEPLLRRQVVFHFLGADLGVQGRGSELRPVSRGRLPWCSRRAGADSCNEQLAGSVPTPHGAAGITARPLHSPEITL